MEKSKAIGEMQALLQKRSIMKVVTNAVLFSTLLLLLFLPCFQTESDGAGLGGLIGIDFKKNFSLYDEVAFAFSLLSFDGDALVFGLFGLTLQIFAVICFACGLGAMEVDLIKSTLYFFDPEHYTILEHDKIKSMIEKSKAEKQQKEVRQFLPQFSFFFAIALEMIAVIFFIECSCAIDPSLPDYYFISLDGGVAWGVWVVLIFLIVDVVLAVLLIGNRYKLKDLVLKEDDEKKDTMSEQAEN